MDSNKVATNVNTSRGEPATWFLLAISACDKGSKRRESTGGKRCNATTVMGRDTPSYGAALNACARSRQWQLGLKFLSTTELNEVTVRYGTALIAGAKGRQWQLALKLIGTTAKDDAIVRCGAALNACAKSCQWYAGRE